jgi:hypothetical protein
MLIFGIIGIIAVIALASYFMLGNKVIDNPIKDGKYEVILVNPEKSDLRLYVTFKDGNKIKMEAYTRDSTPFSLKEYKLIKSDMKVTIDGKEYITYIPEVPEGVMMNTYYVQDKTGKIYSYYKNQNKLDIDPSVKSLVKQP